MKIGILTQPLKNNYGGLLQNYALQMVLKRAGHTVETIDWGSPFSFRLKLFYIKTRVMSRLFPNRYQAKYRPTSKEEKIIGRETEYFISKYICRTKCAETFAEIQRISESNEYDAYVVGSDQCWRPLYNRYLPAMYLSFTENKKVKRVAYAASFGTDQWEYTQESTAQCAPLAQKFDLVTVREDSGVKLCKDHLGVDATYVLDPTMLLTKEDYIQLIEAEKEPKAAGTLFNYILDPAVTKTTFINRVAEEMNLKPFQVLPKYQAETRTKKDVKKRIEDCVFPGVTTWLRAFMDAEMTIVDSFHGMVFSILFNKPFWVIGNAERGMSRFTSLLRLFNLEDRLLNVNELGNVDIKIPIDWTSVNNILHKRRMESINLLLGALR